MPNVIDFKDKKKKMSKPKKLKRWPNKEVRKVLRSCRNETCDSVLVILWNNQGDTLKVYHNEMEVNQVVKVLEKVKENFINGLRGE